MRTLLLVTILAACGNDGPADNHHQPDASPMPMPTCGDGTRDATEECDGSDLAGKSCTSLGLGVGALHCSASCALDTSSCHAACTPRTCAAVGAECGAIDDGCGNPLACGSCTGTETCGGGGHPNQCGMGTCTTHTCAMVNAECGTIDDGCGHALACGSCTGTETCGGGGVPNQCGSVTPPTSPWIQIATGSWHTCGLRQDGTLWCWGRNNAGQLGLGTAGGTETTPQQVGTSHGWTKITAGSQHTCGIQFAHMYCWGRNDSNQLGDNTTTDRVSPTLIASAMEWNDVTAGFASTCAWNNMFEVYCWGNNDYQQIADALGPVPVPTYRSNNIEYLSLGGGHQCWQYSPDNLYCRGLNTSFQLGANITAQWSTTGHVVTPESNWQWHGVFAGGRHTCAFGFVGTLVCWGDNQYGQLGNPGATESLPDYVDGLTDWAAVGMGDAHTCGIKANGNLLCWGANDAGQIGDTTHVDRHSPVLVGSGWASVAGGFSHTCALRSDQRLFCWGDNTYGALGFAGGSVAAPHEVL